MMDRPFAMAFGISVACHCVLLGTHVMRFQSESQRVDRSTLDIIYDYEIAEHELRRLERGLTQLQDRLGTPPGTESPTPRIRIPDRPTLAFSAVGLFADHERAAVIDLTNLVDASQGDPVLLSYFSAIREQIQETANRQMWVRDRSGEGVIYIAFDLDAGGRILSVKVLGGRSAPSRFLQDVALRIVKASSPFAPFPPSIGESSKTIVVPLEFLIES